MMDGLIIDLFGSRSDNEICDHILQFDEYISIFNTSCLPFLDTEIFTLGQLWANNTHVIRYNLVIFKLERMAPP